MFLVYREIKFPQKFLPLKSLSSTVIMLMYNLIGYRSNYFDTTPNLWFYLNDKQIVNNAIANAIVLNNSSIRLK